MGHGFSSRIHCAFYGMICVMCAGIVRIVCMIDCIWNSRVRKHNLRGSERKIEHDSSKIELC